MKIKLPKYTIYIIILLALAIGIFFIYKELLKSLITSSLKDPKIITVTEIEKNKDLEEINTLFELDSTTDAIKYGAIKDVDRLKLINKTAFQKASNGNVIVIYPDKIIIYDPINKNIVDIAMVKLPI